MNFQSQAKVSRRGLSSLVIHIASPVTAEKRGPETLSKQRVCVNRGSGPGGGKVAFPADEPETPTLTSLRFLFYGTCRTRGVLRSFSTTCATTDTAWRHARSRLIDARLISVEPT